MITYVVGSDGSGGVTSNKLELHIDPPKQILLLGPEPGTGCLVQREGKELPPIEDLGTMIAPRYVKILIEVAGRGSGERDGKSQAKN